MGVSQNETFVEISTPTSEAKIALHGAHVYSWKVQDEEQLFLSSACSIDGPAAIRGGIPICFPVFGPPPSKEPYSNYSNLKSHGFARIVKWTFDHFQEGEDWSSAQFSLSSKNEQVKKVFKPNFEIIYTIKIEKRSLKTSLKVKNPSELESIEIQALFHNYLRLPMESLPKDVGLKGLKGLEFSDKVNNGSVEIEHRDRVDFLAGEVDRVYKQVPSTIQIHLGNSKNITLKTSSLPDLTVWNPHVEKSNALVDMEKDGWKRFVCVEPGHTSFVTIPPQQSWNCSQELIA